MFSRPPPVNFFPRYFQLTFLFQAAVRVPRQPVPTLQQRSQSASNQILPQPTRSTKHTAHYVPKQSTSILATKYWVGAAARRGTAKSKNDPNLTSACRAVLPLYDFFFKIVSPSIYIYICDCSWRHITASPSSFMKKIESVRSVLCPEHHSTCAQNRHVASFSRLFILIVIISPALNFSIYANFM